MRVIKNIHTIEQQLPNNKGLVIAIGNFDGCHFGHKSLLSTACEQAKELGLQSAILTFTPHPKFFFQNSSPNGLLQTESLKIDSCAEQGIDLYINQTFEQEFASLSPDAFIEDFLIKKLNAKVIITGFNFHFGKMRLGDTHYLENRAIDLGFKYLRIPPKEIQNEIISSTRIRELVRDHGDVERASALLTRPYCYEQTVSHGNKIGRKLKFPTANLAMNEQITPKVGVYIAYASVQSNGNFSKKYRAVVNVGYRPTLEEKTLNLISEVHIIDRDFDHSTDLYEKTIRLYYLKRLRSEIKFNNIQELSTQISSDVKAAQQYFDDLES